MKIARAWYLGAAVFGVAGVLAAGPLTAQVTVTIDADDIGGVVTGRGGPEAGVWVIAETADLGTKFAKMVVTDDQGRYVLPDRPKAKYKVWVRGYGLVDSAKVDSEPGKTLNLRATPAPNAAAAAEYYPAIYWYSMIKVPEKGEFPGTAANGFNPAMKSQGEFLNLVKTNGCVTCHQLGNKATRTIPKALGEFKNGHEGWFTRRIQSWAGGPQHGQHHGPHGHAGHLEDVRRLDRPRRQGRAAGDEAAAAAGRRAQRRGHGCGTGRTRRPTCMTRPRPTSAIRR